jgi:hypothetical protein
MGTLKWMAMMTCLVACSSCSVISGTVTDVETGEPLPEVRVGVIVIPPGNIVSVFEEHTRTDSEGRYRMAYGFAQLGVSFRLEDYLSYTLANSSDPFALDVTLNSITPIKGTWNATITVEGAEIPATRFEFVEDGMIWRADDAFLGEVAYAFDGDTVTIDGYLGSGDVSYGELQATLELNEAGDSLSGEISFTQIYLNDVGCIGACTGTVVAVPVAR